MPIPVGAKTVTWRVARSLLVLRDEVDAAYPHRTKGADGTIGDAAHQAEGSASDHNPWVKDSAGVGVVRALDVTHDPAHDCDTYAIAERMRLAKDRRLANGGYIISNRRITGPVHGWQWVAYSGSDPHTGHMHVSVSREQALYDDESPWAGVTEETDMPTTPADANVVWAHAIPNMADRTKPDVSAQTALAQVWGTLVGVAKSETTEAAQIVALTAAVKALATSGGGTVDVPALLAGIDTAVARHTDAVLARLAAAEKAAADALAATA